VRVVKYAYLLGRQNRCAVHEKLQCALCELKLTWFDKRLQKLRKIQVLQIYEKPSISPNSTKTTLNQGKQELWDVLVKIGFSCHTVTISPSSGAYVRRATTSCMSGTTTYVRYVGYWGEPHFLFTVCLFFDS
jgi:hypothetical protein